MWPTGEWLDKYLVLGSLCRGVGLCSRGEGLNTGKGALYFIVRHL